MPSLSGFLWLLLAVEVEWRAMASSCSAHSDCASCAKDSTILGPCRFCPVDQACHDPGAVATNPCASTQNIVDPSQCISTDIPAYDEAKAKAMTLLSAVAYSDNQQACLDRIGGGYEIVDSRVVTCPTALNGTLVPICNAYVAVSKALNRVVLAYRGSVDGDQIVAEVLGALANYREYAMSHSVQVGKYFFQTFQALQPVFQAAQAAIAKCGGCEVWVTGHSLGAALASLASTELSRQGVKVTQYTFGQPRVGSFEFALEHDRLVKDTYRIVHADDLVPHVPWCRHVKLDGWLPLPICASWGSALLPAWYHHGTEVFYPSSAMEPGNYKVCRGLPHNEDLTSGCSDAQYATAFHAPTSVDSSEIFNHRHYFGIALGFYCDSLGQQAELLV